MSAVLELVGVTKRHGSRVALDEVSLSAEPGRVLALLGPNGAGKTTLVSLAAGLARPDAGSVRVLGGDPAARGRAIRRRIGIAPQEIGVYPQLTVRQNLRAFGELHGLGADEAARRAADLLEPLALNALAERPAGRLSGGEQRRLHAAIALVGDPALILLDEPTAGADTTTRDQLLAFVRDLAATGAAVVYTTHYLAEVERLDAVVAVLEAGRVIAQAPAGELVARHARPRLVLRFAGAPPAMLAQRAGAIVEGATLHLACADPAVELSGVIAQLGEGAGDLRGVEVQQPSLEAAYLALTGRRDGETDA